MRFLLTLVVLLAPRLVLGLTPSKRYYDTHDYYVIEHDLERGASLADAAHALGVEVVEQVGELENHWLVRTQKPQLAARGERHPDPVISAYQSLRARASASLSSRSEDAAIVSSIRHLDKQIPRQRFKRAPPSVRPPSGESPERVAERFDISDPLFGEQWHLVNREFPQHTMNVIPVWDMGLTGKGVMSAVIDDGLDFSSEDLADNFDETFSYDFNNHGPLKPPESDFDHHGTRCAGQIAAGRNSACGVGIAYDSKVSGIRILSKPIIDVDEAVALNYGFQNISVYSCSWGPPDNGRSMGAPSYLIKKAVLNGINKGRRGKGSIFVFASGNGAGHGDQCNFDGYTNSIYSVTVSAVDYMGKHPYYSEACAANLVAGYSSGSGRHIVTTDNGKNKCSENHGGTSAAAPNVAGVFVLAVQARPELTWRDIQYLSIETAGMINPDDPDWERTATGRLYSYKYGYGVIDAYRFVKAAQTWPLVKPQAWIELPTIQLGGGRMEHPKNYSGGIPILRDGVTSKVTVTRRMLQDNNFEKLEHVNVQVWIDHTRRGDVEVELISPNGIKSVLAQMRAGDESKTGFPGWIFMSVKHWGENPIGDWTIRVTDQKNDNNGSFLGWNMRFWGSTIDPSKAKKYEQPLVDNVLPPLHDPPRPIIVSPVTTSHSRPTAYLTDGAHSHQATGKPTHPSDDDWITGATQVVNHHRSIFGAIAAMILFGTVSGIIFWRSRMTRANREYSSLPANDDLAMRSLSGDHMDPTAPGAATSAGPHPADRVSGGLGFHSSFLDDDDTSTIAVPTPRYRDEPDPPPSSSTMPLRSAQVPGALPDLANRAEHES